MSDLIQIGSNRQQRPPDAPQGSVYIRTYGCQMNEYDSSKLLKILENGYRPVDNPESADVIIVNTCSVRDKPEQKLYSLLGELRDLKRHRPDVLVGVGGCVAQQEGENIVRRSSSVDFVFGTHNLSLVPSLIARRQSGMAPQVAVDYRDEWEELPLGMAGLDNGRVSAFVSISRGCNKNCTYCIVPVTRGPEVSRKPEEIEKEVRIAVHRGAKEIVLLGQTVNSYGLDFSPRWSFLKLLERVAAIDGVQRIRFTSPHPQEVRQDFVDFVANEPKVCRHIHMPLQSGNDRVLKAMNRNYRRAKYMRIIDGLRARIPDIGFTTDIIVGFPGETDAEFRDTLDVMREVRYQNSYSFVFSPRPGTPAVALEDTVPADEKLARLKELQALQEQITAEVLAESVGKVQSVLIDGPSVYDPQIMHGRSSQNVSVNMDVPIPGLKAGEIIDCQITSAARFSLKGRPAVAA
jgi:tRNA-2-methylthio-N6-dimethylallyladenosine synthase